MVNGLYGLSGERSKAKNRAAYGIPEGTPAGLEAIRAAREAAERAAQQGAQPTASDGGGSGASSPLDFLASIPNKLMGQPTWMLAVGAAIFVMYFFKGSSKGRK